MKKNGSDGSLICIPVIGGCCDDMTSLMAQMALRARFEISSAEDLLGVMNELEIYSHSQNGERFVKIWHCRTIKEYCAEEKRISPISLEKAREIFKMRWDFRSPGRICLETSGLCVKDRDTDYYKNVLMLIFSQEDAEKVMRW